MPTALDTFPAPDRVSQWAQLADGRIWKVKFGENGQFNFSKHGSAAGSAQNWATYRGMKAKYRRIDAETFAVQFVPISDSTQQDSPKRGPRPMKVKGIDRDGVETIYDNTRAASIAASVSHGSIRAVIDKRVRLAGRFWSYVRE